MFLDLQNIHNINIIPEIVSIDKIILQSDLCISIPFTSPSIFAKYLSKPSIFYDSTNKIINNDDNTHGVKLISNKFDLEKWINETL